MKLSFDDCVLDMAARQLLRGGTVLPLEPKMFELLVALIQRRPAVVAHEELDEILWPKVYVARSSLNRLVSELRSALGDSPHSSRIIRTAHKAGYAFCATVKPAPGNHRRTAVSLVWQGQVMPLEEGEHIAGRGSECSVVIDATTVSRHHARIMVHDTGVTIEDLNSTNGTWVNGVKISTPVRLINGYAIALGTEKILVSTRDPSATTIKID